MQLACVAATTNQGVSTATPRGVANYWLDTWYAPRVLHFSAFHFVVPDEDVCD